MPHTKGPWKWERLPEQDHPTVPEWTLKGPDVLCRFWHDKPPSNDAHLIAAAPALLAACKAVVTRYGGFLSVMNYGLLTQLKAAIEAAEPKGE